MLFLAAQQLALPEPRNRSVFHLRGSFSDGDGIDNVGLNEQATVDGRTEADRQIAKRAVVVDARDSKNESEQSASAEWNGEVRSKNIEVHSKRS